MIPRTALGAALVASSMQTACSLALDFDATSAKHDDDPVSFCGEHLSPPAVFCDDFDEQPLGTKWPAVEQSNASVQNDSGAALSPPSSLLSVAQPSSPGNPVRSVGSVAFPSMSSAKVGLRISFALRVDKFDPTSGAECVLFSFLYGPEDDFNQVALDLVSTETAVSLQLTELAEKLGEASDYAEHGPFTIKPSAGEWTNVAIDIDVNAPMSTGNTVRVSVDGHKQLDTSLMLPLKGETPRLELGIGWVDTTKPTQGWTVRYDDFLVEAVMLR